MGVPPGNEGLLMVNAVAGAPPVLVMVIILGVPESASFRCAHEEPSGNVVGHLTDKAKFFVLAVKNGPWTTVMAKRFAWLG